jgi:hypothetical protein
MNDSVIVGLIVGGFVLVAVVPRIVSLERRFRELSRVNAKLDALLKHAGIQFDPFGDVPPGVVDALRRGKKIEAIKSYRETTGVDLRDAKEYVEEIQRRAGR